MTYYSEDIYINQEHKMAFTSLIHSASIFHWIFANRYEIDYIQKGRFVYAYSIPIISNNIDI